MSGYDEMKPRCGVCGPDLKNGFDSRRLITKNRHGNGLNIIASDFDEQALTIRIGRYPVPVDRSDVIFAVYCTNCGNTTKDESFVFSVKRYIWFYKDAFGMDIDTWNKKLNEILYGVRHDYIADYDEFVDEDEDICPDCEYSNDECACGTCPDCGFQNSECEC